jgi:hypothetical protein
MAFNSIRLDPTKIKDIGPDALDERGDVRILPAAYWRGVTREERALFCMRHALYGLPTVELIAWLRAFVGDRPAIEIGAGNGVMARAAGLHPTDNWMQDEPAIRLHYAALGQSCIRYGAHVERLDAHEAVARHRPEVVVATWVTHRYDEARPEAGGNMFGVREEGIVDACASYVFIGNRQVHAAKSLWTRACVVNEPDWLCSRAFNGKPDFIAIWGDASNLAAANAAANAAADAVR